MLKLRRDGSFGQRGVRSLHRRTHLCQVRCERRLKFTVGDARRRCAPLLICKVDGVAHFSPEDRRCMHGRLIPKTRVVKQRHLKRKVMRATRLHRHKDPIAFHGVQGQRGTVSINTESAHGGGDSICLRGDWTSNGASALLRRRRGCPRLPQQAREPGVRGVLRQRFKRFGSCGRAHSVFGRRLRRRCCQRGRCTDRKTNYQGRDQLRRRRDFRHTQPLGAGYRPLNVASSVPSTQHSGGRTFR